MKRNIGFIVICLSFLFIHYACTYTIAEDNALGYFSDQEYKIDYDDIIGEYEITLAEDFPVMEQQGDNGLKLYLGVRPVIRYTVYDGLQLSIMLDYQSNETQTIDSIVIKTNEYRAFFSVIGSKTLSTTNGKQNTVSINLNNENMKLITSMCDDQQEVAIRFVSNFNNYDFTIDGDDQVLISRMYKALLSSGISINERKDNSTKMTSFQLIPSGIYEKADKLEAKGQYWEASLVYLEIEGYLDSKERAVDCQRQHTYVYAQNLLETKHYDEAIIQFEELGDYKDSKAKIELSIKKRIEAEKDAQYASAIELYENRQYKDAWSIFLNLGNLYESAEYMDKCNEMIYQQAILYEEEGMPEKAIGEFATISNYKDSLNHLNACRIVIAMDLIKVPNQLEDALKVLAMIDSDYVDYEKLCNAKYLLARALVNNGDYSTAIIVYSDIVEYKDCKYLLSCTERLRQARAFKQVCYNNGRLFVLMGNGKLNVYGSDAVAKEVKELVSSWEDVIQIDLYDFNSPIGLKSDGTVYYLDNAIKSISKWKNIVEIEADSNYVLGRQSSGRVLSINSFQLHRSTPRGTFDSGQYKTSEWRDIIDISSGIWFSIGLNKDGKIKVAGKISDGGINRAANVKEWSNIESAIAINFYCVALDKNGNVHISDRNETLFTDVLRLWAGYRTVLVETKNETYSMYYDEREYEDSIFTNIAFPSEEVSEYYIDEDIIIGIANEGDCLLLYDNELMLRKNQYEKIDVPAISFTNGLTTFYTSGIWVFVDKYGEIVGIKDFLPIKKGSKGIMVNAMQSILIQLGYSCDQNGVFDKITQECVDDLMEKLNIANTMIIEESFLLTLLKMI